MQREIWMIKADDDGYVADIGDQYPENFLSSNDGGMCFFKEETAQQTVGTLQLLNIINTKPHTFVAERVA